MARIRDLTPEDTLRGDLTPSGQTPTLALARLLQKHTTLPVDDEEYLQTRKLTASESEDEEGPTRLMLDPTRVWKHREDTDTKTRPMLPAPEHEPQTEIRQRQDNTQEMEVDPSLLAPKAKATLTLSKKAAPKVEKDVATRQKLPRTKSAAPEGKSPSATKPTTQKRRRSKSQHGVETTRQRKQKTDELRAQLSTTKQKPESRKRLRRPSPPRSEPFGRKLRADAGPRDPTRVIKVPPQPENTKQRKEPSVFLVATIMLTLAIVLGLLLASLVGPG